MKVTISILIAIILSGCATFQNRISQEFIFDLGSENNRLAGDLYLDYFNEDLTGLTYDYYLTFITKNEAPSAEGFACFVKTADYHFFKTSRDDFIIALFYKKERTIICDNSYSPFIDSSYTYREDEIVPELSDFVSKVNFKRNK